MGRHGEGKAEGDVEAGEVGQHGIHCALCMCQRGDVEGEEEAGQQEARVARGLMGGGRRRGGST
jgi:hypothetical protein